MLVVDQSCNGIAIENPMAAGTKRRGSLNDRTIVREPRDIGDRVRQQVASGLVQLGRRLLEPEMQDVALTPYRPGFGRFTVHAPAAEFQFGRLSVLVHVTAPARLMASILLCGERKHFNDVMVV